MAIKSRMTGKRDELDRIIAALNALRIPQAVTAAGIEDGTTDGKLKTTGCSYRTAQGALEALASTDDLWDLSGETDTGEDEYRAYWLYEDGSVEAGADVEAATFDDGSSGAAAALPAPDPDRVVIGVYVAGPETDFDDAAGLQAQGFAMTGIPSFWIDANAGAIPKTLIQPVLK